MDNPVCDEFRRLVETSETETPLQTFLEAHPDVIVRTFNQGTNYTSVFPKFRLADEFVPDFVMIGHRSIWSWDVDIIEIEPSLIKDGLFNRDRQSKGRLRGAESQVTDWQVWMGRHEQTFFVRRALEKLKEVHAWDKRPEFYQLSDETYQPITVWYRIIVGRRSDYDGWGNTYRAQKWEESGRRFEIVPWDRLLEKAHGLPTAVDP